MNKPVRSVGFSALKASAPAGDSGAHRSPVTLSGSTPLEALATLGREIGIAAREYQRLNDPDIGPHGTLQVIRSAMIRANEAVACLIGHEEGSAK